ncbi:MAG: cation:proton antiporter, partial [Myxococcales bacterium]
MAELPVMVGVAFVFGISARFVGLPPLVGFLIAGFALNAAGLESTPMLQRIADAGVTLLLFTIGLKLRVRTLLRPTVWGGATLHMAVFLGLFGVLFYTLGFGILSELDLQTAMLIAFALSFSSTVFAVKAFEAQGQAG